jgi:hypothetical protein
VSCLPAPVPQVQVNGQSKVPKVRHGAGKSSPFRHCMAQAARVVESSPAALAQAVPQHIKIFLEIEFKSQYNYSIQFITKQNISWWKIAANIGPLHFIP